MLLHIFIHAIVLQARIILLGIQSDVNGKSILKIKILIHNPIIRRNDPPDFICRCSHSEHQIVFRAKIHATDNLPMSIRHPAENQLFNILVFFTGIQGITKATPFIEPPQRKTISTRISFDSDTTNPTANRVRHIIAADLKVRYLSLAKRSASVKHKRIKRQESVLGGR